MVIYMGINFEVFILLQDKNFINGGNGRDMPLDRRNSVLAVRVFRLPISRTASDIGRKEDTVENEDFEVYYRLGSRLLLLESNWKEV